MEIALKKLLGTLACTWTVLGLSTLHFGTVSAQDIPVGGEPSPRAPGSKLERVEILGKQSTDNDLRRRAQTAKQIYGREELDKYGDGNVADVLKRLPGISMQGNAPRMRGLGSGYTLILINGDPAPPGFALDQLDPAQVERIEVTKGPTANQSAQAVAGAGGVRGAGHALPTRPLGHPALAAPAPGGGRRPDRDARQVVPVGLASRATKLIVNAGVWAVKAG